MLRIEREYLPSGGIEVRMNGHADAPRNLEGHDLVCAAASILCITLGEVLKKYCHKPVCNMDVGQSHLKGTPRRGCAGDFWPAYDAVMLGFELLAKQYPQCLEVGEWK